MKFFKLPQFIGILIISLTISSWFIINHYEQKLKLCKNKQNISYNFSSIELEHLSTLDSLSLIALKNGKEEMAKHKIVITGITRDNIRDVPITIKHIEYIGSFFKDYRVILFENDSTDGTKLALDIWQIINPKVNIISKDFFNKKRPNHKFMADARNNYLEYLNNSEYADFDLLMVLDMDLTYGIDIRGIEDSFSKINAWDAVCSNGISTFKGNMYDTFAFRNDEFPWTPQEWQKICSANDPLNPWTRTCKKGEDHSKGIVLDNLSFITGWQKYTQLYWLLIMPQIQKIYPVNSELIPVSSCFGGLAIYKREFIKDCEYDSIENDCEHVAFHQCIKDKHNGKMFLNPSQMIRYSQHNK